MEDSAKKRFKLLYIIDILKEHTDSKHTMTLDEISNELERFEIFNCRQTLSKDLSTISDYFYGGEYPYAIQKESLKHNAYAYKMERKDFSLAELKLMVDAIQCCKFLTKEKSDELIKKILKMASISERHELDRQVCRTSSVKALNDSIFENIDTLHKAIAKKRQISFQYADYTMGKEKKFRGEGKIYQTSPYGLIWNDEYYYLVSYKEKYGEFVHFRVDRMYDVKLLERVGIEKLKEGCVFDLADYSKKTFCMFNGDQSTIKLKLENEMINSIIDKFGLDLNFYKSDENYVETRVQVAVSDSFFAWISQFRGKVVISAPNKILQEYIKFLDDLKKIHSC